MFKFIKRLFNQLWFYLLLLIVGGGLVLFPLVGEYLYFEAANEDITSFITGVAELEDTELDERLRLAQAYNDAVDYRTIGDPWTDLEKEGVAEYARMLEVHEQIGYVEIPKIDSRLPVYAGTSEVVLQKGVGHLEGTALPIGGLNTHSVITAHRGLPTAQLFRELDKLEIDDVFFVTTIQGKLAYQVDQITVVEPNEIEAVRPVEDKDVLTLLTCTPYMINSHRLLVRGERIEWVEEETPVTSESPEEVSNPWILWLVGVSAVFLILIFYVIYLMIQERRK